MNGFGRRRQSLGGFVHACSILTRVSDLIHLYDARLIMTNDAAGCQNILAGEDSASARLQKRLNSFLRTRPLIVPMLPLHVSNTRVPEVKPVGLVFVVVQ